jgi:light-regulated signal transduction histidine kinase (bacteriophytochrome)
VWGRVSVVLLRDETATPLYFLPMIQDITQAKQAEREIRQLNAELEQRVMRRTVQLEAANKELEAFTYSVSHDLRAPLRAIDGYSKILLDSMTVTVDEESQHYLTRLRESAQRMTQLVNDLLNLSRLSRAHITRTEVNLSQLAQALVDDLRESQPERAVQVRIQLDMVASADANLMRVVLDNLLRNAWKFTSKRPQAQIEFASRVEGGETVYFVRDNGAGFDMAYAEKLFVAFQRLHSEAEFEGTGIGLTIVQRIIHRHGGRVWAESAPEQGATFYFTLAG